MGADPNPDTWRSGRAGRVWIALLLFVLTLAVWLPVRHNGFVGWDDPHYVSENRMVQRGLTWGSVKQAFSTTRADNWHPLTWLSHMLDRELFGAHAAGHHMTSAVLHALNAALLFLALASLTRRSWPAALTALVFALHPQRVESVAWISERKDVLSGFFWMLSLWAYARYARGPSLGRYGALASAFALGLMSKPVGVSLPFVLLLFDAWPLARRRNAGLSGKQLLLEKLPLLALVLASSALTLWAQRSGGALSSLEAMPPAARVANALLSYAAYLADFAWPSALACFYPHPMTVDPGRLALTGFPVLGALALLLALSIGAWRWRRSHPFLAVGWGLFLGTLVPMIGLLQVGLQARADRYTYLPSIGLALALAYGLAALPVWRTRWRYPGGLATLLVLGAAALATRRLIPTWRDDQALFGHAIEVSERNYLAHNLYAADRLRAGELAEAHAHFERGLELRPRSLTALQGLGMVQLNIGAPKQAAKWFAKAARLRPHKHDLLANWAHALELAGEPDKAASHYQDALEQRPHYAPALLGLGRIRQAQGRSPEAVQLFEQVLEARSSDPDKRAARDALAQLRRSP